MMKQLAVVLLFACGAGPAYAEPISSGFASKGEDRKAIEALLTTYTKAVSTKDEALFETLLLSKDIPFSGVGKTLKADASARTLANYDDFRRGVFSGAPFTQRFQKVRIEQDGLLANVSLVFVNSSATSQSWGWKTLQLLKVDGKWKIASEFYTGHAG